jgi:hypothetical protein
MGLAQSLLVLDGFRLVFQRCAHPPTAAKPISIAVLPRYESPWTIKNTPKPAKQLPMKIPNKSNQPGALGSQTWPQFWHFLKATTWNMDAEGHSPRRARFVCWLWHAGQVKAEFMGCKSDYFPDYVDCWRCQFRHGGEKCHLKWLTLALLKKYYIIIDRPLFGGRNITFSWTPIRPLLRRAGKVAKVCLVASSRNPFPSDLRHAAIHKEFDAVDEAAVVGREEHNRFGDFIGCPDATEGNAGDHGVYETLHLFLC